MALGARSRRDELPRHFRSAPYVLDIVMDIGAYRDLHRHRRCHQFRQQYTNRLGYETPELVQKCGAADVFEQGFQANRRSGQRNYLSLRLSIYCRSPLVHGLSSSSTLLNLNTSRGSVAALKGTSPIARLRGR